MNRGTLKAYLLVVVLLAPTLSFAPPDDPSPLTAAELRSFLLDSRPSLRGAQLLFQLAHDDPKLRKQLNTLISQSPELKGAAEQGLLFRTQTQQQLGADFPTQGQLLQFGIDPIGATFDSFQAFRKSQDALNERPVPPHIARQRALNDTIKRYGLPRGTKEDDFRRFDGDPWEFFRRQAFRKEQETTLQRKKADESQQKAFEAWKQYILDKIRETRARNVRQALEYAIKKKGDYHLDVFQETDGKKKQIGRISITPENLPQLSFTVRSKEDVASLARAEQVDTVLSRLKTTPTGILTIGRLFYHGPNTIFEGATKMGDAFFIEEEAGALQKLRDSQSKEHVVIDVSQLPNTELGRHGQVDLGMVGNFIFNDLRLYTLTDADHINNNLGGNPKRPHLKTAGMKLFYMDAYIKEAAARDVALATLESAIQHKYPKDWRGFEAKLATTNKSVHEGLAEKDTTLSSHVMRDRLDKEGDLVTGLEWNGYKSNPNYWSERDSHAEKKKVSSFADSHPEISTRRGMGRWLKDGFVKVYTATPRMLRPLFVWSAYGAGIVGAIDASQVYQENRGQSLLSKKIADAIKGKGTSTAKEGKLGVGNLNDPSNVPADEIRKSLESVHYKLSSSNPIKEAPNYFDIPHLGQYRDTRDKMIQVQDEPHSASTLRVEGVRPNSISQYNIIAIPIPSGHQMADLQVRADGKALSPDDYAIHQDLDSGVMYVSVFGSNRDKSDFTISAGFKKNQDAHQSTLDIFQSLDPSKLKNLAGQLREAGFSDLAHRIETRAGRAEKGKPASLDTISSDFSETGIYTFSPPVKNDRNVPRSNPFATFSEFLRDGKLASQCNTANQFLAAFLREYYKDQPEVKVENIRSYMRVGDSDALTGGNRHLRTVVTTHDGAERVELDGTPSELDIPRENSPFYRLPKADQSKNPTKKENRRPPKEAWYRRRKVQLIDEKDKPEKLDPETHWKRLAKLEEVRKQLMENPFLKEASRGRPDPSFPSSKAMRLSNALRGYASGEKTLQEVGTIIEALYPDMIGESITAPKDLREALVEIAALETHRMAAMKDKVVAGGEKRFAAFGNDALISPIQRLFTFMAETNWTPLPPGVSHRGNKTCAEAMATVAESAKAK